MMNDEPSGLCDVRPRERTVRRFNLNVTLRPLRLSDASDDLRLVERDGQRITLYEVVLMTVIAQERKDVSILRRWTPTGPSASVDDRQPVGSDRFVVRSHVDVDGL